MSHRNVAVVGRGPPVCGQGRHDRSRALARLEGLAPAASEAGLDKAVFTGTVSTDGLLVSVHRHLEGGDITLSPGPHSVGYRFTNYGGVDGIDFVALCASTIRVTAYMNGHLVPASHIVIGAGNTHPGGQPIVIHKTAS